MGRFVSRLLHGLIAVTAMLAIGCSGSAEDQNTVGDSSSDSGSILTDTLDDSSGSTSGEPGSACDNPVFPNPIRLPDSTGDVVGSNGLMLTNVATDHPYLTPNGDGHHDDTVFTAEAFVDASAGTRVRYAFEVYSVDTCAQVDADLTGEEELSFEPEPVEVEVNQDFDSLEAGAIVERLDDMAVSCAGPKANRPDACVAFETTGKGVEHDLRTGDLGRVLIFPKNVRDSDGDGLVDKPDDTPKGGTATFAFDSPVSLDSIGFLDIDRNEAGGTVVVTTAGGDSVELEVPVTGNGERATLDVGVENVSTVSVSLTSSGAITHIDYTRFEVVAALAATEGYARLLQVWDATGAEGQVADGNYIYRVVADLLDSSNQVVDSVETPFLGMQVDSRPADFNQDVPLSECVRNEDEDDCLCPSGDASCTFVEFDDLVDITQDPGTAGAEFITTVVDPFSGRAQVIADLTTFNGGGLIPVSDGVWESGEDLRAFVSELTGVPASTDARLFNFDYVQIGYSTAVHNGQFVASFNNALLDAITDEAGFITVGETTLNLFDFLNNPVNASEEWQFDFPRSGDECTRSGGYNGTATIEGDYCVYAEAIELEAATQLGIYSFRSAVFDINTNETATVTRERTCNDFNCGVRTFQTSVEFSLESIYYTADDTSVDIEFFDEAVFTGPSVSRLTDRLNDGSILSGECSRAVIESNDVRARMDSADGTVGDTCVANGIFD